MPVAGSNSANHQQVQGTAAKLVLRSSSPNLLSSRMQGNLVNETRIATVRCPPLPTQHCCPSTSFCKMIRDCHVLGRYTIRTKVTPLMHSTPGSLYTRQRLLCCVRLYRAGGGESRGRKGAIGGGERMHSLIRVFITYAVLWLNALVHALLVAECMI